jgi:hypothetical protein
MTHGRDEAESDRRVQEVRETMSEYWDVGADDWETLFSTRILKKNPQPIPYSRILDDDAE